MSYRYILFFILGIDAFLLFFQSSSLSISSAEASILYGEFSFLQLIVKTSLYLFGQNDFALRLPMITMHILSAILLYKISNNYLPNHKNRLWLVLIFILLPGVISSAIIVDSAGLIILGLFLFIYMYENLPQKFLYILLSLYLIMDGGFVYLFLALAIYSIYSSKRDFFIFNIIAFFISIYLFGTEAGGAPSGHFLDALAVYCAIFNPIIFIYLFYILYRRYLTKDIDVLWFIASVAFGVSLILSFRQRVELEHFAPYLTLALPLAAQTFYHSYRVRLKMFRTKYRVMFFVSLGLLIINSLVLLFNKEIYLVIAQPDKHFAYNMHVAKELAQELKDRDIRCIQANHKMSKRLKFYGIDECDERSLIKASVEYKNRESVTISYKNRVIYVANVTEINTK